MRLGAFGALLAASLAAFSRGAEVVRLNDDNFEHDTQAASGATTGDWIVAFVGDDCEWCSHLVKVWEELSEELEGEINVAIVDCSDEKSAVTCRRFYVEKHPVVIDLHKGQVYPFVEDVETEVLKKFAFSVRDDEEYESKVPPFKVPGEPHNYYSYSMISALGTCSVLAYTFATAKSPNKMSLNPEEDGQDYDE